MIHSVYLITIPATADGTGTILLERHTSTQSFTEEMRFDEQRIITLFTQSLWSRLQSAAASPSPSGADYASCLFGDEEQTLAVLGGGKDVVLVAIGSGNWDAFALEDALRSYHTVLKSLLRDKEGITSASVIKSYGDVLLATEDFFYAGTTHFTSLDAINCSLDMSLEKIRH